MDELRFPAKKLRALWFAPPHASAVPGGSGVDGPLPRVFISELLVEQMSTQTQVCIYIDCHCFDPLWLFCFV